MIFDKVKGWLSNPHPATERFDEEFTIAIKCSRCGKIGYGPRKNLHEAVSEHFETPACKQLGDKAGLPKMNIYYPKV